MNVGFIGLGRMGTGMAVNLLKAGHDVTGYNRTVVRAQHLLRKGGKAATNVAQACQGEAVISMLANDEAVESLVLGPGGVASSLRPGALHVSSSTISVALSQRLAREHAKRRQRYVAAPVFGRPEAAAKAQLLIVAGGGDADIEMARPLLEVVGRRVIVIGPEAASANLIKLSGNFLMASAIEALGEAFALVGKGGIDGRRYLEIVTALFDSPPYRTYGALIADGEFKPAAFAAPLGQKDIRLLLAAADSLGVAMPLGGLLHDRFLTLLAHGDEGLDWSAIGGLAAKDAAMPMAMAAG